MLSKFVRHKLQKTTGVSRAGSAPACKQVTRETRNDTLHHEKCGSARAVDDTGN